MDEFIIWDDGIHTFAEAMEDKVPSGGFVPYDYIIKCDGYLKGALNGEYPSFKNIGLKDINGKSIYTDSSICKVNYFSSSDWISDYCYFSFDTENLRYIVHLINEKEIVDYESSYFDCFEIIDTIQENKLGLIK